MRRERGVVFHGVLASFLIIWGCEREARRFEDADPEPRERRAPYGGNAWAMNEGARLYGQMNCVGCHAHGGGGMGPALTDGKWLYGADGPAVFASIMNGRPNGMPSYAARLSKQQGWQLAMYVRSLSGQAPASAAPGRDDHMAVTQPPSTVPAQTPVKEPTP
jgi:cytochrome c oxidase cbb3-type subunit III